MRATRKQASNTGQRKVWLIVLRELGISQILLRLLLLLWLVQHIMLLVLLLRVMLLLLHIRTRLRSEGGINKRIREGRGMRMRR